MNRLHVRTLLGWALISAVIVLAGAGGFDARAADPIKIGLANNEKYKYPNYFQIQPSGPDPEANWATGFFEIAAKQNPKPQTIALVGADAEYPRHAIAGARELVKKFGFKNVYDKSYPPSTVDYTPIARAIKAVNPDIVFVASYPPDSVGRVRAAQEIGLQPKS